MMLSTDQSAPGMISAVMPIERGALAKTGA